MAPKATSGMIALEINARSSKKGSRCLPLKTLSAAQFVLASPKS
jgi:hypothetical protein